MKMRKVGALLVASSVILAAGSAQAVLMSLIDNGDFEAGIGLPGWDSSLNTIAATGDFTTGVSPNNGDWMAIMAPGGTFDADLSQVLDPTMGFDTVWVGLSFNLWALDVTRRFDFGSDFLTIDVGGISASVDLNDPWNGLPLEASTTGWLTVPLTPIAVTSLSSFSISFNVENVPPGGGDPGQFFKAYIDDVYVIADVQVADGGSTVALLGLMLVVLQGMRRKLQP